MSSRERANLGLQLQAAQRPWLLRAFELSPRTRRFGVSWRTLPRVDPQNDENSGSTDFVGDPSYPVAYSAHDLTSLSFRYRGDHARGRKGSTSTPRWP